MELALYHPEHGFYSTGGSAGRRGDFLTSPEVGPLFGAVLARALDAWWDEAGRPDPYVVAEAGAGPGTLARAVLAAGPRCRPALRYLIVERSSALRQRHRDIAGVASRAELPADAAVVLANELLDNLPFGLAERAGGRWRELWVGESLREIPVDLSDDAVARLDRLAPRAPEGARVPLQHAAARWLHGALDIAGPGGRVVVIDYASTTAAMAARPWLDWLRTYRGHQRGDSPLAALGRQDITVDVAVDQLAEVRPPTADRSQAEFLAAHGLDQLVAEGRAMWTGRAHIGDLAALRARSRIREAEALTDRSGLGAFRVLEWR